MTDRVNIVYDDEKHKYTVNGEEFPSVTKVLDRTLPKPGLVWWAWRIGLAAATALAQDGTLSYGELIGRTEDPMNIVNGTPAAGEEFGPKGNKTYIEALAMANGWDTNAVKNRAASRGTGTHDAMAVLLAGGVPDISEMIDEHRRYVSGLLKWWRDQEPLPIDGGVEVPVASLTHRYAGRLDLLHRSEDDDRLTLTDLKTGKELREDGWFRQLMAYKMAWEECGGEPIERMQIVLCKPDATYAVYDATYKIAPHIWLANLEQFRGDEDFKALNRKRPKPRKLDEVVAEARQREIDRATATLIAEGFTVKVGA